MSLILFLMSIGSMSHVDFKKSLCRPVKDLGVKGHIEEAKTDKEHADVLTCYRTSK